MRRSPFSIGKEGGKKKGGGGAGERQKREKKEREFYHVGTMLNRLGSTRYEVVRK